MDTYLEFIKQSYYFPTEELKVHGDYLYFRNLNLVEIAEAYGTPLRISVIPKIREKIATSRKLFEDAIQKYNYKGSYIFSYCTKSSHFSFVIETALNCNAHIETSSAYDLEIMKILYQNGKLDKNKYILCNGYKLPRYIEGIKELINDGFEYCIPVIDNIPELGYFENAKEPINIGLRVATDEEPGFEFYTSRLGISPEKIPQLYTDKIEHNPNLKLKMLHFFVNSGISDSSYYWDEFSEFLQLYCKLWHLCPELDTIDIGGGLPIKNSLDFNYDYEYMIDLIVKHIQTVCAEYNVPDPHLITEFGNYTVGESGIMVYSVQEEKWQNDKEIWYMIDNSFINTLPDTWGLNQKFLMLPLNYWNADYNKVNLGGITCDSMDYYNSEANGGDIFLPVYKKDTPLYLGFFNTGAYQEALGGYGGIQHCLIPSPKHILIDQDENGLFCADIFSGQQSSDAMLKILGY